MKTTKFPDTSKAAQLAVTEEMKNSHYGKIIKALKALGVANYEKIANYVGFKDRNQVSRRLKEMMPPSKLNPKGLNLVFQPGTKSPTSSGRAAYNYQLTGEGQAKTEIQEKTYKKGETAASDFAGQILAKTGKKPEMPKLFE